MNHFSLFTGIGGIDLAAEWVGYKSVGQCEWADFQTKVLEKNWPNVPRWRDVRDVTAESVRNAGIQKVDLISGGFPCQPFSVAGKRKGKDDDRDLWPEMFRVIRELQPTWVIGENVANFVNMELERTLTDLESEGYETQTIILPACGVNAKHQRYRAFIMAHSNRIEQRSRNGFEQSSGHTTRERSCNSGVMELIGMVADSNSQGSQGHGRLQERAGEWAIWQGGRPLEGIWQSEPQLGRVANGIPARVDRLKSLGNAVVPQQVYPILKAIWEIHHATTHQS